MLFDRKKATLAEEDLGRSKGGFTSKIHMISDALGMPLAFCMTGGKKTDCQQAIELLEQYRYEYALLDKAYDLNGLLCRIPICAELMRMRLCRCDSCLSRKHSVQRTFTSFS
ncbi:MAG: transposase [Reinekea sp.]